ncbi:unnamed protein product [Orchesella dallaii]|uniref:Uncharacterized protein n=1 Tax=Orchesella dallaii TaxID=48710 RepID=A0ABP1S3H8_9HEXA
MMRSPAAEEEAAPAASEPALEIIAASRPETAAFRVVSPAAAWLIPISWIPMRIWLPVLSVSSVMPACCPARASPVLLAEMTAGITGTAGAGSATHPDPHPPDGGEGATHPGPPTAMMASS